MKTSDLRRAQIKTLNRRILSATYFNRSSELCTLTAFTGSRFVCWRMMNYKEIVGSHEQKNLCKQEEILACTNCYCSMNS